MTDLKGALHDGLRQERAALLGKLDGVSEREARRPRTATGTNLLGLVKHCAACELGYFGATFDRPSELPFPWDAPGARPEDNVDMFALEGESSGDVLAYAAACFAHADATIDALDLDAPGRVPWWPAERADVTLGLVLVRVALDEARHAGHADILREQLDGVAGRRSPGDDLPAWDPTRWAAHRTRLERIARTRGDAKPGGAAPDPANRVQEP